MSNLSISGMSLRDYFAAQALIGLLSNNRLVDTQGQKVHVWLGKQSYWIADEMLKAREVGLDQEGGSNA